MTPRVSWEMSLSLLQPGLGAGIFPAEPEQTPGDSPAAAQQIRCDSESPGTRLGTVGHKCVPALAAGPLEQVWGVRAWNSPVIYC